MKIAIVGTGYVGLCSGAVFADIGHEVCCVDRDEAKIAMLDSGKAPIYEPGLQELLDKHRPSGALSFTTSIAEGIAGAKVVFIAVGTPRTETGEANMIYVENVSTEIARNLDGYKVVAEKSTVPVQTGERIRMILTRDNVGNHPFDVVSNPEFLREGTAVADTMKPDRVVIGTDSPRAADVMRELYAPILEDSNAPFVVTDISTAELIKHASNAFLATKISFINAIACVCERCGADVRKVAEGMGYDRRIGPAFLAAGVGYGGSCFPKDVDAFIHIATHLGYDFALLKAVREINTAQRSAFVGKIKDALWNLQGKRIAVWGLAFKPMTDDMRNAPSIGVVKDLVVHGADVVVYDPVASEKAKALLPDGICVAGSALEAADGADCVVVMTEWDEFRSIDLDELKNRLRYPIVVDGRNLYDRETMEAAGFTYRGVGV